MIRCALALLAACGGGASAVAPGETANAVPTPPAPHADEGPANGKRLVPAEAFLRAYLMWFGGLAPDEIARKGRPDLFDQWNDYLNALGFPDYQLDLPRATQSNTVRLATLGRLAELLCVRSVEHDLRAHVPVDQRVVFAFETAAPRTRDEFAAGLDVLHRTFLGYPLALGPSTRLDRFYRLFQQVAARPHPASRLTGDELGWAAVCTALVQHPEAGLY